MNNLNIKKFLADYDAQIKSLENCNGGRVSVLQLDELDEKISSFVQEHTFALQEDELDECFSLQNRIAVLKKTTSYKDPVSELTNTAHALTINEVASQKLPLPPTNPPTKEDMLQFIAAFDKNPTTAQKPSSISLLSECSCDKYKRSVIYNFRKTIEDVLVYEAKTLLDKDSIVTYVSLGSGELLQDWMNLGKLVQSGFTKFNVILIDPCFEKERVLFSERKQQFTDSLKLIGVTQLAVHYCENVFGAKIALGKKTKVDILTGIDLESRDKNKPEDSLDDLKIIMSKNGFCIQAIDGSPGDVYFASQCEISANNKKQMSKNEFETFFQKIPVCTVSQQMRKQIQSKK